MDTRLGELEEWADIETSLYDQIYNTVTQRLASLSVNDSAISHKFVTAVSQNNGTINVSRDFIGADDITSGTLGVSRGGTGLNTIPVGHVIVGNGTNTPTTKEVQISINDDDALVTAGAIKDYVDSAVEGIAGAMHFIGFTTDAMSSSFSGAPTITGKSYINPVSGDVVIYGNTEWIYNGSNWQELGTEGDYAVKGSIRKQDLVSALQTEINGKLDSTTAASTYVAQNGTDRLMTEAEGTKLSGIAAGAQVNTIESITLNGVEQTVDANKNVELTIDLTNIGTVKGARVADAAGTGYEDITIDSTTKKLEFARIAKTGDIADLDQTSGTILVLNCGTASTVI